MKRSRNNLSPRFLPMSRDEMEAMGWQELDILIVTGDAYVDHPSFGAAAIGRALEADGWRVGIAAMPDWRDAESLKAMGRPKLFCGVTAGNVDSMVANYTAARHRRKEDSYSENGVAGRRPNRAATVYAQLCRRAFPGVPIVLGGVEASLRRVAHYDYWTDKIVPSVLVGSKADLLVFGMGESQALKIARRLADGDRNLSCIPGTARLLGAKATAEADFKDCVLLPSFDDLQRDKSLLLTLTKMVEREQNPYCGRRMAQLHGDRALVVEPPAMPLCENELDALYELKFTKQPHPSYKKGVPAHAMIKDSVAVVRGCPGGCSFCGLGMHQGRFVVSRSRESVLKELRRLAESSGFKGTVTDLGGPSANLYGCRNDANDACRRCRRPSCLFPSICSKLRVDEERALRLLRDAKKTDGVRHLFVQSGIRMDLAMRTPKYLRELVRRHVSGHLKVAPEHLDPGVLKRMRKPAGIFEKFQDAFRKESAAAGKEQYLVPYFISGFPGCGDEEMAVVERFLAKSRWNLQQVQDFIPIPMTPAAAMYATGLDYDTGEPIAVPRGAAERKRQKRAFRPGDFASKS